MATADWNLMYALVMEMHQVRYFLAMTRLLNFTKAADECHVSQPSLTRAIQKLEEEFDGALFRRERSRTHLTDLGRLMLPHLQRTYDAALAAKELARHVGKAQVTPLALGIASTVETSALCVILGELRDGLAGFELSIRSDSSQALVDCALAGELDLVIVEAPDDDVDRFEAWPLFEDVYRMLVHDGHRLADRVEVSLSEIGAEAWIDCGGVGFNRLRDAAQREGIALDVKHRAPAAGQLRQLVLIGLGCAFVADHGTEARLRPIKVAAVQDRRTVVLAAISGRRRSVAAEAFVRASRARSWTPEPMIM